MVEKDLFLERIASARASLSATTLQADPVCTDSQSMTENDPERLIGIACESGSDNQAVPVGLGVWGRDL